MRRFTLAVAAVMVAGCATLTTGTKQSVTVLTPEVKGASCELTDAAGMHWFVKDSPDTVIVTKGDGPMTVVCEREGFETTTLVVEEEFEGATLGNVILGGGIGVIIDAASGAAQQYPDQITVWMRPQQFPSEAERERWEGLKLAWEQEREAAAKEQEAARQARTAAAQN